MLKKCKQRIEADATDQWAIDVLARVEDCVDFVAAESRYHSNYLLRFNQNKASEKIDEPKSENHYKSSWIAFPKLAIGYILLSS